MDMMKKTLAENLPVLGLELSDAIQDQLCAFGHAMVKQNEVMNLTGITQFKNSLIYSRCTFFINTIRSACKNDTLRV